MPVSDIYTGRATLSANTATTATPVLSVFGLTTKRGWLVGARVEIVTTTAPAGANVMFQLARPSNSPAYTSSTSGMAQDYYAPASILQQVSAWTTAPTFTATGILAEWVLPQTTGAMWEEFPPAGYEWGIPQIGSGAANAGIHLFITQSAANATTYSTDLVWSE